MKKEINNRISSNLEERLTQNHRLNNSNGKNEQVNFLYLAEMGLGTKAYDPLIMDGLLYFLKVNKIGKKINFVIMQGGLIPRIPEWYGKLLSEDMRFLAQLPPKERGKRVLKMAEEYDLPPEDSEYFNKYIEGKIITKTDAAIASKIELTKIAKVVPKAKWHYQEGEEDIENKNDLKEIKLIDYQNAEENIERLSGYLEKLTTNENNLKEKLEKLEKIEIKKKEYEIVSKELDAVLSEKRETELKKNAIKREMEASGFFAVTKRRSLTADKEELLFRLTKKEYQATLADCMPDGVYLHLHSTKEKRIGARWTGTTKGAEEVDEIEPERLSKIRGLELMLIHNTKHIRSSNTTKDSIARMKEFAHYLNLTSGLYDGKIGRVPDMMITAHGADGFAVQPQRKEREVPINGEDVKTPEVIYFMKLPSFQSMEKLQALEEKGIRNWHLKRYAERGFADGVVLQEISKDGLCRFKYITGSLLKEYGETYNEIKNLQKQLKKAKKKTIIEEKISILKKKELQLKKIGIEGDYEIGMFNIPGMPSTYELVKAEQEYQRRKGLPDLLITSEAIHGEIPGINYLNTAYQVPLPSEIEEKVKNILKERRGERREQSLVDVIRTLSHGFPITIGDLRVKEWANRFLPYIEEILEKGGEVLFVSGNHYSGNNPGSGRDEATIQSSHVDKKYRDAGKVHKSYGVGENFGSAELDFENHRIYASHKLREGSDELSGADKQIRKANIKADLIAAFDRHHPIIRYSDGSMKVLAPGNCPWNAYVDKISKQPSLNGIINAYIDKDNKGYYEIEFVLNPVIEPIIKKNRKISE